MPTGPRARARSCSRQGPRPRPRSSEATAGARVSATRPPANNSAHSKRTETTTTRKETQRAPALMI
eukprot:3178582-Heterocapsa_arctica.AAC.1